MTEENTNNESAEEKADNSNSWIDNIFNWVGNPEKFVETLTETVSKEIADTLKEYKAEERIEDLLRLKDDFLPAKALLYYSIDSAKARMKASALKFSGHGKYTPSLSQKEVDDQRTFKADTLMSPQHMETLDFFVRKAGKVNEWKPSRKGKDWYSINLLDKRYKPLLDKDDKLWAMAKTLGRVDFKKDPITNTITYADKYDYDENYEGFLGPSEGPEFTWGVGRPFPTKKRIET